VRKRRAETALLLTLLAATSVGALSVTVRYAPRLLVVDSTKSLLSTMWVAGFVAVVKSSELPEVDVRLSNVPGEYDEPLSGQCPGNDVEPYDFVVMVPRGLDDGSATLIWIVSDGRVCFSPAEQVGMDVLKKTIRQAFAGVAESVDVSQDLFAGCLWALYRNQGWIR